MQRRYIILLSILLVLGLGTFYVWYAHASIYWKLGAAHVNEPSDVHNYTLGPDGPGSTTYAAIGDSLTAGVGVDSYQQSYPYDIARFMASAGARVTLEPYAVPGVRTQYVIDHFLPAVVAAQPKMITLFIGINDIHGNVSNATFRAHYNEILSTLTTKTKATIYVINLPYIGTPKLIGPLFRLYFTWRIEQYNAIIKQLADQYHLHVVDLYDAHKPNELDNTYYAADHFHQNALGYSLWAHDIYASIHQ
jgi:lysophospholipase L1-like esterase